MLLGSVFTDNQVPYSVWLTEEPVSQAQRVPNEIAKAQSRRLRRMQSQNFVQRAAFEWCNSLKDKAKSLSAPLMLAYMVRQRPVAKDGCFHVDYSALPSPQEPKCRIG